MPAPTPTIDLNADLGEEAGFDEALLGIVTSANVACGAHAGSSAVAAATAHAAAAHGVVVGAHPGHADRANFGRVALPITADQLGALLDAQLAVIAAAGGARYLKLHGALYHQAADDPALAAATVRAAQAAGLAILAPPATLLLEQAAAAGIGAFAEGFVDRGYELVGGRPRLIARGQPGAILEPEAALAQAVRLAIDGTVVGPGGAPLPVPVDSLCVHGDTPGAVEIARRVRLALEQAGVELRAFAG